MIAVHAAPQLGDQVQAGDAPVTGPLVFRGAEWSCIEAYGTRMMFPNAQLLMLSERHVVVPDAEHWEIDRWSGPIERAHEGLEPGRYLATSTTDDGLEHDGVLTVGDDGTGSTWQCGHGCPCPR